MRSVESGTPAQPQATREGGYLAANGFGPTSIEKGYSLGAEAYKEIGPKIRT